VSKHLSLFGIKEELKLNEKTESNTHFVYVIQKIRISILEEECQFYYSLL